MERRRMVKKLERGALLVVLVMSRLTGVWLLVQFVAMNWKRLLAGLTGSVDQDLLLRNEYLATENRILRNQLEGRLRLSTDERIGLAEIGKQLGRKALEEVAQIVRPETILAWYRKLVAKKFDGAKNRW